MNVFIAESSEFVCGSLQSALFDVFDVTVVGHEVSESEAIKGADMGAHRPP